MVMCLKVNVSASACARCRSGVIANKALLFIYLVDKIESTFEKKILFMMKYVRLIV